MCVSVYVIIYQTQMKSNSSNLILSITMFQSLLHSSSPVNLFLSFPSSLTSSTLPKTESIITNTCCADINNNIIELYLKFKASWFQKIPFGNMKFKEYDAHAILHNFVWSDDGVMGVNINFNDMGKKYFCSF